MIRRMLLACFTATWLLTGGCGGDSSLFSGSKKSDTALPGADGSADTSEDGEAVGSEDGGSETTNEDGADLGVGESSSDGDSKDVDNLGDADADDSADENEDVDTSSLDGDGDDVALHGPKKGDRIIIRFRPGATANERAAMHRRNGLQLDRAIPQLHMHVVKIPPGKTAEEVMARYDRHPLVEYVEQETFKETAATPNDPWFGEQWNLHTELCDFLTGTCFEELDATRAWNLTTGNTALPIAILDTGLDVYHYEFANRFARGEITGYDFADNDGDFYDPMGHGTVVGGVIGAEANNARGITGASWQNPTMVLRTAFGLDTIEAITWATDNGARVISMSFGGSTPLSWEQDALQYAYDRGVVLVGAAGNAGTNQPFYPAAYPIVLAVTGVDAEGVVVGYNWGDWIDLTAPVGTLTTFRAKTGNIDNGDLGWVGGTSLAAPFVSAAAGLVLSLNPDLSPAQVMEILRNTADDVGDPGFDVMTGYGRVNFYNAVQAATGVTPPPPDTTAPSVAVINPIEGAVLGGTTTIVADASDDTGVVQVDLYCNTELIGSDGVAPHEWSLDTTTLADGAHSFYAIARDAAGNSTQSASVLVTIDNASPCDATELVGSTCNDGLDNDCDGLADCADGDCASDSACATPDPEPDPVCNGNSVCEVGENCSNCASDCSSGQGARCGNGVCETGNGEDCLTCPQDCNGKQDGKLSRRYCCGAGGGEHPVSCNDSRCVSGGLVCASNPVAVSCCGDGVCSSDESGADCEVDCGPLPFCGDGNCNADEDPCGCPADCGPSDGAETSGSTCRDGLDNDCDGTTDCLDPDCATDPMCAGCDHDGICDAGESCHTCPDDCAGKQAGKSAKNYCCGNGALEPAEGDGSVCDGNP